MILASINSRMVETTKDRSQDSFCGGSCDRVGKVAEFQTGVGSSPALATCETGHVLLAGVSDGFPGVLPFRPTFRLARLDMSEKS